MRTKKFITISLLTASTLSLISLAKADTQWLPGMPWTPRFTLAGQAGNQKDALLDAMLPIVGDNNSLWYVDTRAQLASYQTNMLSAGLGYRQTINDHYIIGGYGLVDTYLSPNNERFSQATVGGEYLSNTWDARANAYIPFGNTSHLLGYTYGAPLDGGYYLRGHKIYLEQYSNKEIAEPGAEIEVGHSVPFVPGLRAYVGYYHFGTGGEQANINGPEARLDYQINNNIALTMSEQHDNVRGNLFLVGTRISLGGAPKQADHPAIANRMEDFVIRNFPMVTYDHVNDDGIFISPENVYYTNNTTTAGGDGTYEHPYQSASQASQSANNDGNANNIIYIYAGNGDIYDNGGQITLKTGQTFIGSGVPFIYRGVTLLNATSDGPTLSERINLASNTTLGGFNIDGGDTSNNIGIYGNGVNNITINNVNIKNLYGEDTSLFGASDNCNGACGIDIENSSNVTITNINISNITGGEGTNGSDGIDGSNGTSTDLNGNNGNAGGNGNNGGNAIGINITNSSNITASNVSVSHLTSGAGGTGGIGGNGGNGAEANNNAENGGNGGNGAAGGNGGNGGNAYGVKVQGSSQISLSNVTASSLTAGNAGDGNIGGNGGNGGNGDDGDIPSNGGNGGIAGKGGNGGTGGNAAAVNIQSSHNVDVNNATASSLTAGNGGFGQSGGNGGTGGAGGSVPAFARNSLAATPIGSGGSGGTGGVGGNGGNGGNAATVSTSASSGVTTNNISGQNLQAGAHGNGASGGTGGGGGKAGPGTKGDPGAIGIDGNNGSAGQNGQVTN